MGDGFRSGGVLPGGGDAAQGMRGGGSWLEECLGVCVRGGGVKGGWGGWGGGRVEEKAGVGREGKERGRGGKERGRGGGKKGKRRGRGEGEEGKRTHW